MAIVETPMVELHGTSQVAVFVTRFQEKRLVDDGSIGFLRNHMYAVSSTVESILRHQLKIFDILYSFYFPMLNKVTFAVINDDTGHPITIDYIQAPHIASAKLQDLKIHGVRDFYYAHDVAHNLSITTFKKKALQTENDVALSRCLKLCRKNEVRVHQVIALLRNRTTKETPAVGPGCLFDHFPERNAFRAFTEMHFEYPNFSEVQYLHIRTNNSTIPRDITTLATIKIVVGLCLFNTDVLNDIKEQIFSGPLLHIPITLCELEVLCRLCNAVADVVCSLPSTVLVGIDLDIPRLQYILSPQFSDLSEEAFLRWIAVVNTRQEQLQRVATASIQNEIFRRGGPRVQIRPTRSLECLFEGSTINRALSVAEMRDILRSDPCWDEMLRLLPKQAQEYVELFGLSYVLEYIKPMLLGNRRTQYGPVSDGDSSDTSLDSEVPVDLVIAIDSIDELKTMVKAKELISLARSKMCLIGLYVAEKIFTNRLNARSSLYHNDPGNYCTDSDGRSCTPAEIVQTIFGESAGIVLDALSVEGLLQ